MFYSGWVNMDTDDELIRGLLSKAQSGDPSVVVYPADPVLPALTPLQEKLSALLCVKAGWAFGVPEDGRQQWLDLVEEAVREYVSSRSASWRVIWPEDGEG